MRCAAWRPRWKYGTAGRLWYFAFGARAPTDGGECRGQPGNRGPALQQPPVGDDARTAPAGAFRRPTGPQARLLGRRSSRGCSRRRECPRADMESAPTNKILCFGPTGWRWHLCRFVGEGHGPPVDVRGTARPRGRGMPLPYKPSEHDPRNRTTATHRASVGRDAPIPPHPAAARTTAGGYGIRPYG